MYQIYQLKQWLTDMRRFLEAHGFESFFEAGLDGPEARGSSTDHSDSSHLQSNWIRPSKERGKEEQLFMNYVSLKYYNDQWG